MPNVLLREVEQEENRRRAEEATVRQEEQTPHKNRRKSYPLRQEKIGNADVYI